MFHLLIGRGGARIGSPRAGGTAGPTFSCEGVVGEYRDAHGYHCNYNNYAWRSAISIDFRLQRRGRGRGMVELVARTVT